jgi:hypothetical protein
MLLRFIFAAAFFHNCDPNSRRQLVHSHRKIDMLVVHHEAKNAAPRSAPKTVKSLALRTNREGRRFFLMKRTERLKTGACSLQRKISSDHFHDVVRGCDLLDCFRRDRHFSLVPACLPWQT